MAKYTFKDMRQGANLKTGGFEQYDVFQDWHESGVVNLSESGILNLRKLIQDNTQGVVMLNSSDIHYNEQITRQMSKNTWYGQSTRVMDQAVKMLVNFSGMPRSFDVSNQTPKMRVFDSQFNSPQEKIAVSKNVTIDTGIDLIGGNRLYLRMSNGIRAQGNILLGFSCPTAMNVSTNDVIRNAVANTPITGGTVLESKFNTYDLYAFYGDNWDQSNYSEILLVITKIDLRGKKLYYKTISRPSMDSWIDMVTGTRTAGSKRYKYLDATVAFIYPPVILPTVEIDPGEDSWKVTRIPYTVEAVESNGKGNLLLMSHSSPSVVGYTKSEYSYQDEKGISKLLTPIEKKLSVNISRSSDDTYTNVVIDGSYARVENMKFHLLILGEDGEGTYINEISSPLPGESRNLEINLPVTIGVQEINFNSMLHNSLVSAIKAPNIATNYSVGINVQSGFIHMEGAIITRKGENDILVVHLLPIQVKYYPGDNSKTTSILNQAFTIKVDVVSINDTVQVTTGISTVDYSYSTSEGINMRVAGVSKVLPTNFMPYLRSVQLDAEAMVVNGDTIGFTVNVDKLVNKQILGTSTGYTEYYMGGKK